QRRSWFYRVTEYFFESLLRVYDRTLQWVLRFRPVTMVVFFVVLGATAYLFVVIPKGFIPDQDTDQLFAVTEAAQGTSYYKMVDYQNQIAELVRKDPNVEALVSTIGGASAAELGGPNFGQLVVRLKPRAERRMSIDEIILDLRQKFQRHSGVTT